MNRDKELEQLKEINDKARKEEEKLGKFGNILGSFGISAGLIQIVVTLSIGSSNPIAYLAASAIGTVLAWPAVYVTNKKVLERSEKKEKKEQRCIQNTLMSLRENRYEKDQTIGKTTTNFYKKVELIEERNNIKLTAETSCYINDLFHLINANYYPEIATYLPYLEREQLIDKVSVQVELYLNEFDKKKLTNKDISNILTRCFFLKNSIKEKIIAEYNDSTVKFGNWTEHSIENRNIDILDQQQYLQEKRQELTTTAIFDIENIDDYQTIIQGIIAKDQYLSNFGDTSSLTWDMQSLQNIICIIAKDHRRQLLEVKDEYCNFDLTVSFIYNAMCYGIMNHKNEIGQKELLATFREWNYLPFELRATIASDIIEKQALEANLHPFYKTKPKEKTKVIPISSIKKD